MIESSDAKNASIPSRDGLISVPLVTRPREGELRPYLKPFQAFIIGKSLELIKSEVLESSNINLDDTAATLRKLVTALSTELPHIRVPVIWALQNKLVHLQKDVRERAIEDTNSDFESIIETTGIFLSHFDIARHLNEAEARVAMGDDTIDEALFIEIADRAMVFDENRAAVFSNSMERTKRLDAVFSLPSGAVPSFTVFSYKLLDRFSSIFSKTAKTVFSLTGAAYLTVSTAYMTNGFGTIHDIISKIAKLVGL